ncbi:MAG TPA: dihydrofolate reductase family protein [Fluviicola sp.]|nr:dihydrofolate reductase family protein [Fluviicola sp.]
MKKLIAAMNMTLDGFCNHTYGIVDDETHQHYNDLLENAGAMLYGRTTYQLMESYWPDIVKHPTGNKTMDDFAVLIDEVPKIVFSRTLDHVEWKNARLATKSLEAEVMELKQHPGKDIYIGSPSLIAQATALGLVDEFQLMVHPVIAGKGLTLFKDLQEMIHLKLVKTKNFACGAMVLYYVKA